MSDQLANKGLVAQDQRAVSGTSLGFAEHPQRPFILGELHARPFLPVKLPRRSYHFAFMTDSSQAAEDRAAVMGQRNHQCLSRHQWEMMCRSNIFLFK